jgi:hypothetical protein
VLNLTENSHVSDTLWAANNRPDTPAGSHFQLEITLKAAMAK